VGEKAFEHDGCPVAESVIKRRIKRKFLSFDASGGGKDEVGDAGLPESTVTLAQVGGWQVSTAEPLGPELRQCFDTNQVLDLHPASRVLPRAFDRLLLDARNLLVVALHDDAELAVAAFARGELAGTKGEE
jgi:hypothetical protein